MISEKEIKYKKPTTKKEEIEKKKRFFKPKIILSKCTKCLSCWVFCPHSAIKINDKGNPVIDYEKCTGCLICLRECPENAIEEESE